MTSVIKRRLDRLEEQAGMALPWSLPVDQWTDEQLAQCVAEGLGVDGAAVLAMTDAELEGAITRLKAT